MIFSLHTAFTLHLTGAKKINDRPCKEGRPGNCILVLAGTSRLSGNRKTQKWLPRTEQIIIFRPAHTVILIVCKAIVMFRIKTYYRNWLHTLIIENSLDKHIIPKDLASSMNPALSSRSGMCVYSHLFMKQLKPRKLK